MLKDLVLALYHAGDIPLKSLAADIYAMARDVEDSVESVANAMDFYGLDGSIAYDMALELQG